MPNYEPLTGSGRIKFRDGTEIRFKMHEVPNDSRGHFQVDVTHLATTKKDNVTTITYCQTLDEVAALLRYNRFTLVR